MFLRVLCVITSALTVLTTLSMTSCGADNAISSEASESAVTSTADGGKTAKDILSAIEGDHMDASTFYGEDSFTKNTKKLYGIEADKLSDGGILYSSVGNYADEISMLKMADGSSAKSQLADRLNYRLNQYENYKPEETKKIQAAKIFQAGDYWVLVISDNADEISDEITDMINKKTEERK